MNRFSRTRQFAPTVAVLTFGAILALTAPAVAAAKTNPLTRSFHMGFTTWPYAATVEAVEDTYSKITQHGDLIAFHLDNGVPWPEAYMGDAFHPNFEAEINGMVSHIQPTEQVYLGICPLNGTRSGLALYRGESGSMPLPPPWDSYQFEDPQVIDAYSSYCLRMIDRFQPLYLNIGIESTDLALNNPALWPAFATFIAGVYSQIKAEHPDLLVGVSIGLRPPSFSEMTDIANAFDALRNHVDYVGASTYPYASLPWGYGNANPGSLEDEWLSQLATIARGKPVAICETGFIAEDCVIPAYGWDIAASEQWQADYVQELLDDANGIEALFVVWWSVCDFDPLWEMFTGDTANIARIWRDTGLYADATTPRAGLAVWDGFLARPLAAETALPAAAPAGLLLATALVAVAAIMAFYIRKSAE